MEAWLLDLVSHLGYVGIFIATMIESTFVPIPAEVTMIPAGMLAFKGELNYWLVLLSSTFGTIAGSVINYALGIHLGRAFILKYGKYVMIKPGFLNKTEIFFSKYGIWAVLIGRLLPGVKHYIAFAAGIAKMRFGSFLVYTALGALLWMWILLQVGYMAAKSNSHGHQTIGSVEMIVIALVIISCLGLWISKKMMKH